MVGPQTPIFIRTDHEDVTRFDSVTEAEKLLGPADVDSVDGYDVAGRRLTFTVASPDLSGLPRQVRRSAELALGAVTVSAEGDELSGPGKLEGLLRTFLVAVNAIEQDERPALPARAGRSPIRTDIPCGASDGAGATPTSAPPNWDEDSGLWEHQGKALTVRDLRMALSQADPGLALRIELYDGAGGKRELMPVEFGFSGHGDRPQAVVLTVVVEAKPGKDR